MIAESHFRNDGDSFDTAMTIIELTDPRRVGLDGLLDLLPGADRLSWSILAMDGWAYDETFDLGEIVRRVYETESGLQMGFGELRELASMLLQFTDGMVAGYSGAPPSRADLDLRRKVDYAIEEFDATYWRIYARENVDLQPLMVAFPDARLLADKPFPGDGYMPQA